MLSYNILKHLCLPKSLLALKTNNTEHLKLLLQFYSI